MVERFRVTFDTKNTNNVLVEQSRTCNSLKCAMIYIKALQTGNVTGLQLVGKPTIERIGK
jgi:hypothetical protein